MAEASAGGRAVLLAVGAQAASNADPVTMPAALRKSRRERYCEYGVISDDFTWADLYVLFMITSASHVVARAFFARSNLQMKWRLLRRPTGSSQRHVMTNMSQPIMP